MKHTGEKLLHENYKLIYSGQDDGRSGVALILNECISERVEKIFYKNERILGIVIKLPNVKMGLIQAYAPQQGRPVAEKEQFYNDLQETVEDLRQENLLLGDAERLWCILRQWDISVFDYFVDRGDTSVVA